MLSETHLYFYSKLLFIQHLSIVRFLPHNHSNVRNVFQTTFSEQKLSVTPNTLFRRREPRGVIHRIWLSCVRVLLVLLELLECDVNRDTC